MAGGTADETQRPGAPVQRRWPWLANLVTLARFPLIPVIAYAMLEGHFRVATLVLVLSAVTDAADGAIARLLDQRTRFGAIADPLADKVTMLTVALLLAWLGRLPAWFAAAIVTRDLVIVAGALAYHLTIRPVEMAPTRLSKFNTVLEFLLLVGVLAAAGGLVEGGAWIPVLLWITAATIVASGVQYVVGWTLKAAKDR